MRGSSRAAALSLLATLPTTIACGDVLHSTSDVRTACELDAAIPGCTAAGDAGPGDAGGYGAVDFCAWSRPEAQQKAQRACGWLGACESPAGTNAFGDCALQALLAYDCAANPNHAARGKAHDLWACMAQVTSCADVARCALPAGPEDCADASPAARCGAGAGADTVVRCAGAGASPTLEPCALSGKTCVESAGDARCGGTGAGLDCAGTPPTTAYCPAPALTELHSCDVDGGDFFIDCASNGAGSCGGFPTAASASWEACVAQGSGPPCTPSLEVTCAAGVASWCPSGVRETIDCGALLDTPAACQAGTISPPFDWSTPCTTAAPCPADACTSDGLLSCTRGAALETSCASLGLGPCRLVAVGDAGAPRAACAPP